MTHDGTHTLVLVRLNSVQPLIQPLVLLLQQLRRLLGRRASFDGGGIGLDFWVWSMTPDSRRLTPPSILAESRVRSTK